MPDRRGSTLFEIAIALLLASTAIAAVLAIFPAGIRVQQAARFSLLATLKAYELIEAFNTTGNSNNSIDLEAMAPWDVPSSYVNLANDLEAKMCSPRFGICPVPPAIARRLDSDGDEIARLLDAGGQLYYCTARSTSTWEAWALPDATEPDAQKLVFAVVGYAQQNAIAQLWLKRWPYYAPYPGPPLVVQHEQGFLPTDPPPVAAAGGAVFGIGVNDGLTHGRNYLWDACTHPEDPTFADDVQKAFWWNQDGAEYGSYPYSERPLADDATMWSRAVASFQGALWFARRSGMAATACEAIAAPLTDFSHGTCPPWRQVLAMRYLAYAATCLTRWRTHDELVAGVAIDGVTLTVAGGGTYASPAAVVTETMIRAWHESCLNLVDLHATSDPYDWGAPRPAERATMMDLPLIQWDLFGAPAVGTIAGTAVDAAQWRPLAARPIANLGTSWSYPMFAPAADDVFSPAGERFGLTARFEPEERCRQLAFWSVDWQSYEDCETAPSAPVDASRWPKAAPWPGATIEAMWRGLEWIDGHQLCYRNPEKLTLFLHPMDGADGIAGTADDVPHGAPLTDGVDTMGSDIWFAPDRDDPRVFAGAWGADRDGDHRLDRGPLGRGARLMARSVARVNFYDPRLCLVLR